MGPFDRSFGEERARGLEAHLQIRRRAVVHAGPVHRREGPSAGHEVSDQTQMPGIHVDTIGYNTKRKGLIKPPITTKVAFLTSEDGFDLCDNRQTSGLDAKSLGDPPDVIAVDGVHVHHFVR